MRILLVGSFAVLGCGDVAGDKLDARPADSPKSIDAPGIDAPTCVPTPAGLQGRWRAENNANDDTNTYNGTLLGGVAYGPGKHGTGAFVLDGTNDVVTMDPGDALWPAASFSLEVWFKSSQNVNGVFIVGKYGAGGAASDNNDYELYMNNGHPGMNFRVPSGSLISITATTVNVADNQWHHMVGVRDVPMAKLFVYVDGAVAVSQTLNAADTAALMNSDGASDPLMIGSYYSAGTTTFASFFAGAIDDVAYFNAALTPTEIAAIYAAPQGECP